MPERAFDTRTPNAKAAAENRVVSTFRLYRLERPSSVLPSPVPAPTGVLGQIGNAVNTVLALPDKIQSFLSGLGNPGVRRILEKEYRFVLILERLESLPEVRTAFTYVRDGYFIDTPFRNAKGITHWRLAGRTHRDPVLDGDSSRVERGRTRASPRETCSCRPSSTRFRA